MQELSESFFISYDHPLNFFDFASEKLNAFETFDDFSALTSLKLPKTIFSFTPGYASIENCLQPE